MTRTNYPALATGSVSAAGCFVSTSLTPPPVRIDSPALQVMTDLTRVPAATIAAGTLVADANQAMIHRGVRMLFVVDEAKQLQGVVTASDILGERALQAAQNLGLARGELRVSHIMTPAARLDTIELAMVTRAEVGHVVATLKACGRQHAFVVDRDAHGRQFVCGVFSATQIARQLGMPLPTGETARTFAEIEAVLSAA
ncbi:CBS domain-containing protein [Azospira restricta]|uniref:CBS domain-containing protein n=1 Tax=Azospira restricta TaxID=404405 RepID=A0A974SMZ0_9RHOO|nr:CBS domain-containing protein [Azospira restricta]QRJ62694.1 CBS domain-containing protein [Azospira restricta]